ncbi:hypothetical protein [Maribacter luteus]|uniref:hypothetical protein n=1 Tax=Maribacter luteus TaxID=2594478 RepID=UPI0024908BBD|nr:hypothetical protein [Maribacter luteus]
MESLNILIIVFLLLTLTHTFLFSRRFIYIFKHVSPNSKELPTRKQNTEVYFRLSIAFVFFLAPNLIYRGIMNAPNIKPDLLKISMIVLIFISTYLLWLSINKLKISKLYPPKIGSLKSESRNKTTDVKKKNMSASQAIRQSILENEIQIFIEFIDDFKFYNKEKNFFKLSSFKIKRKGKTITPAQACFILTLFWYHEILHSNELLNQEVPSNIWKVWSKKLNIKSVNPANWNKFKSSYLIDDKYQDIKELDFYHEFSNYYKKRLPK